MIILGAGSAMDHFDRFGGQWGRKTVTEFIVEHIRQPFELSTHVEHFMRYI